MHARDAMSRRGVAGDAPQRLCMGSFAPSSCSMIVRYI
jgi:hypothetical protein